MNRAESLFLHVLHMTILFFVLVLLMFKRIGREKSERWEAQVRDYLNGPVKDAIQELPLAQRVTYRNILKQTQSRMTYTQAEENACLQNWTLGMGLMLLALTLIIGWWFCDQIRFKQMWWESVIVYACVFSLEYVFFNMYIHDFVPVPPNRIQTLMTHYVSS